MHTNDERTMNLSVMSIFGRKKQSNSLGIPDPPLKVKEPTFGTREGDIHEQLNKKINTIIILNEDYIVFLDDEYFVQWEGYNPKGYSKGYSSIINRVAYLETVSTTHFANTLTQQRELAEFRRLLGEAVA